MNFVELVLLLNDGPVTSFPFHHRERDAVQLFQDVPLQYIGGISSMQHFPLFQHERVAEQRQNLFDMMGDKNERGYLFLLADGLESSIMR